MRDILAEIVAKKRGIVAAAKEAVPLDVLKRDLSCGTFRMAEHFRWHGWGLIAECKLQSPADAVLLIVRILTPEQLKELLYLTWSLGMDALVEVHDRSDLEIAQGTSAEFIGINNRNLVTFETSVETTLALLPYADKNRTLISESGIFARADAARVRAAGCKGVLVGEGLVRAADVGAFARELVDVGTKEQ